MTTPALRVITEDGELVEGGCPNCTELEDTVTGHELTIKKQSLHIGRLERELKRYAEAEAHHPRAKEIEQLIERWKVATDHPKAKVSKDRIEIVKARLKDGYDLDALELAIDGIGHFRYVVNGQRVRTGNPSQRHDALSLALKGGENLERFANLGAQARREKGQECP